ncbi:MAG TPA: hypothetical protein PL181_08465 [bacterium]|nr:hypothetical protein [bacterium]
MKISLFFLSVLFLAAFVILKIASPELYGQLIQEDSPIEWAQAFFYLASACISLATARRFVKLRQSLHAGLFMILAVGLFFIAAEELSWGQRLIHLSTPEYFAQHNRQNEINLHNFNSIQPHLSDAYIVVGGYGAIAWIILRLFASRQRARPGHLVNFLAPDWYLSLYFAPACVLYTIFGFIRLPQDGGFLIWRDQEAVEFLLATGFLLFTSAVFFKLRHRSERADRNSGHPSPAAE